MLFFVKVPNEIHGHKNGRAIFACVWTSTRPPTRITFGYSEFGTNNISHLFMCVCVCAMVVPLPLPLQVPILRIDTFRIHSFIWYFTAFYSLSCDGFVFRFVQSRIGIIVECETVHYRCMQFAYQTTKVAATRIRYRREKKPPEEHLEARALTKIRQEKKNRKSTWRGFNENIHIFAHFICT